MELPSGVRRIKMSGGLLLFPSFLYSICKCSGETVHIRRLDRAFAARLYVINTKIWYIFLNVFSLIFFIWYQPMQRLKLFLKFKYYLNQYLVNELNQNVSLNTLEDALIFLYNGISYESGDRFIKLFPCSIQRSAKFILLIDVKMPTIVGI